MILVASSSVIAEAYIVASLQLAVVVRFVASSSAHIFAQSLVEMVQPSLDRAVILVEASSLVAFVVAPLTLTVEAYMVKL